MTTFLWMTSSLVVYRFNEPCLKIYGVSLWKTIYGLWVKLGSGKEDGASKLHLQKPSAILFPLWERAVLIMNHSDMGPVINQLPTDAEALMVISTLMPHLRGVVRGGGASAWKCLKASKRFKTEVQKMFKEGSKSFKTEVQNKDSKRFKTEIQKGSKRFK